MPVMGIEPSGTNRAWSINVDTDELNYLRQIHGRIEDEQFQVIVERAIDIMSNFPVPGGPDRSTTGLVIGKVQSGKTLSFTTLMALAASNGYKIIIVLAGTTNPLMKQTLDRLERDLGTRQLQRASRLLVLNNPTLLNQDTVRNALSPVLNKTVLIVCLKHSGRISDVRDLLSLPDIPQVPTLIIDDEGDEASHNRIPSLRSARNGGNTGQPRDSATHRSIRLLRESLRKHVYVAYTATPQANLLLPRIAQLSPRFCELISPGPGYCGGSVFFGNDIDRYVRLIDAIDEDPPEGIVITQSLRRALAAFFISAAIRHLRAPNEKHTMLIHTHHKKIEHQRMRDALQGILADWQTRMGLMPLDQSRQDLITLFQETYRDFQRTVRDPPSWEQVLGRMERELYSVEVHMVNSLPEAVGAAEARFQLENNIMVGGNMVGRGVTIEELAITYITRMAQKESNADTMEQRARWFGYKEGYLDLCRIWMTGRLRDIYVALLEHEDDFWESLERNKRQGIPIEEWPRFFRLDREDLKPTRANVARSERFRISGWKSMQPSLCPEVAVANLQAVENFITGREYETRRFGETEHRVYRGVPITQVIQMLVGRIDGADDWDSGYMSEYLRRLQFGHIMENIDVVLMRVNDPDTRRTPAGDVDSGRINLMQGSNREPGDPSYYPGDANFHEGMPQLQIHRYHYRRDGPVVCSLALYIPLEDRFDLSFIVRGDDQ